MSRSCRFLLFLHHNHQVSLIVLLIFMYHTCIACHSIDMSEFLYLWYLVSPDHLAMYLSQVQERAKTQ